MSKENKNVPEEPIKAKIAINQYINVDLMSQLNHNLCLYKDDYESRWNLLLVATFNIRYLLSDKDLEEICAFYKNQNAYDVSITNNTFQVSYLQRQLEVFASCYKINLNDPDYRVSAAGRTYFTPAPVPYVQTEFIRHQLAKTIINNEEHIFSTEDNPFVVDNRIFHSKNIHMLKDFLHLQNISMTGKSGKYTFSIIGDSSNLMILEKATKGFDQWKSVAEPFTWIDKSIYLTNKEAEILFKHMTKAREKLYIAYLKGYRKQVTYRFYPTEEDLKMLPEIYYYLRFNIDHCIKVCKFKEHEDRKGNMYITCRLKVKFECGDFNYIMKRYISHTTYISQYNKVDAGFYLPVANF